MSNLEMFTSPFAVVLYTKYRKQLTYFIIFCCKYIILIPKTVVVAGIPKLRRVLLAYSLHNPEVEYCQVPYTNLIILYSEPVHVIELVKEKKGFSVGGPAF